jgi:hypothetical protein
VVRESAANDSVDAAKNANEKSESPANLNPSVDLFMIINPRGKAL